MCGIIAYHRIKSEGKNGVEVVLAGLKKLEYRGYDSWGIASAGEELSFIKNTGEVGKVQPKDLAKLGDNSNTAIGHTRWATNGGVTDYNAHPHISNNNRFALVHNGIVENYLDIKSDLQSQGYAFTSDTDSEVVVNLIEHLTKSLSVKESVQQAFKQIEGRNAIVLLDKETKQIYAARFGSPLIIGIGEDEFFIASDVPAFLDHTREVNYLDDNQMVQINSKLTYFDIETGEEIQRRTLTIEWSADQAEKGDYPHFMIKEIMEQKDTIRRAIEQNMSDLNKAAHIIQKSKKIFLIGCGTAGKVCHIGEYFFTSIAQRSARFVIASEFLNYESFLYEETLLIVVSQSGETADVLEAMELAKAKGVTILSLVNVRGSSIMRESDHTLLVNAGPEQAVASTKATTAQLAVMALLAFATDNRLQEGKLRLIQLAGQVNEMLNPRYEDHIRELAEQIQHSSDMYIIGRGVNFPLAKEAAIKLQEVSYIHGEGFAGGELKHGPLALISDGTPILTLVANDRNKQAILSNATEVKSRGGYIIGIGPHQESIFDYWLRVPNEDILSPIVNIIPIQILAYHLGVLKGNNPDKPRNLAKSVTVK